LRGWWCAVGAIVEERTSNLEVAKANFNAACEEVLSPRQDRDRAHGRLGARLTVSSRSRRSTSGPSSAAGSAPIAAVADDASDSPGGTGSLSTLVMRTPFDGIVEDVFVARGERVRGDPMFVVADTSLLWVRANPRRRRVDGR
jgi:multidrug resistance efflux pump